MSHFLFEKSSKKEKTVSKRLLAICFIMFQGILGISQIPDYVPTNGLVGWWPFSGNATDNSTHHLDGTVVNAVPVADRFGNTNSAYYFNGSNAHIEVPHNSLLNALPLTISVWFKPADANGGGTLISKYMNASWNGWNVGISGPSDSTESMSGHYILQSPYVWGANPCNCGCRGIIQGYGDCGSGITYTGELYDQQWHLSTFVVDSVSGRFYLDGQQVSSQVWAGIPQQVNNWYSMLIGAYRTFSNPWSYYKGKLDDVGVWNRALSADEIADLYVAANCTPAAQVYNDYNQNCSDTQLGVGGVVMEINPGGYVTTSDYLGDFYFCNLDLPDGTYTASLDPEAIGWESNCPLTQSFQVTGGVVDSIAPFRIYNDNSCPDPDISIVASQIRRCSEHTWPISMQACNSPTATGPLVGSYAIVEFDEGIIIESADLPYTSFGGNTYQFETGDINPGECVSAIINANFSCDLVLGETLCMEASLYPIPECIVDTVPAPGPCSEPWDHSSLSVNGWCDAAADSVYFTVSNSGEAMVCSTEVRVYLDNELFATYYIQLQEDEDITFAFPSSEETWILQADQHPLHPGNSHPNDHVEGCGDEPGGDGEDDDDDGDSDDDDEWERGLADDLECGDDSPITDTYCAEVTGSFDPNDKTGWPGGIGEQHDVLPNQQMQYLIRFQNTGTAEAYRVVVRDTLDADLNIGSVRVGAASHNYEFTMYGQRILEWTFNNIMLPDSFSNEPASHGFLSYTVGQNSNLPDGTTIENAAAIYFDFNEPVITNTTVHTVNRNIQAYAPTRRVTFRVDMHNDVGTFTQPFVSGSFNNWCGNCNPMQDADGDGIWESTISLQDGSYTYKITTDNWTSSEMLWSGMGCTTTADNGVAARQITVSGNDLVIPVSCYGSCTACETEYNVTFQVDMTAVLNPQPVVRGDFNEWCNSCMPMSDNNGDGIYTVTVSLPAGSYRFEYAANQLDIEGEVMTNGSCIETLNGVARRKITINGNTTLSLSCYGQCSDCGYALVNDHPYGAINLQYSTNLVYPNCMSLSGNISSATPSAQDATIGGKDIWYRFDARSEAVSIYTNAPAYDDVISIYGRTGNTFTLLTNGIENAATGIHDTERLNVSGLTPGNTYYICVGSADQNIGAYSFCLQHLMPSGCASAHPAEGFSLCNNYKASYRGSLAQGVAYSFQFDPAQDGVASTSVSGTNGLITLSNNALALQYGSSYSVKVDATYNLQNSAGVIEPITIVGTPTGSCANMYTRVQPLMEVASSQRCPAVLSRNTWLKSGAVVGQPSVCGAISYTFEFTPISSCTNNTVIGASFETTRIGGYAAILLTCLPSGSNNSAWSVRVRPNFQSVAGTFGPAQIIFVTGSASSAMLPDSEAISKRIAAAGEEEFNIYPNPSTGDEVNVSLPDELDGALNVRLFNSLGKIVFEKQFHLEKEYLRQIRFDQPLADGMYVMEISADNMRLNKQLIVETP